MQPCRDSRDGGGSALHIVTLWFDPGYEGAAPGRGKRLAGRLLRISLFVRAAVTPRSSVPRAHPPARAAPRSSGGATPTLLRET